MVTQMPKTPVTNNRSAINGAYLQLGILVGRLYNLGESEVNLIGALRKAAAVAKHDGVGQEA